MKKLLVTSILFLSILSCSKDEIIIPEMSLTTKSITDITENTAKSGGVIIDESGKTISAKGVCWSTEENPTIADNRTNDVLGAESFTSTLTGLFADKTYYVRSYVTSSTGTIYGSQRSFTTLEKVYIGGITLRTQEEVNEFGQKGYSSITNSLSISSDYAHDISIKDLKPLASINSVGNLSLRGNDDLPNLEGLNNITSVGRDLQIVGNDALLHLEELHNITSVGRDLQLNENDALINLEGLNNITSVGEDVYITRNSDLTNLNALINITFIGGNLVVIENNNLTNLDGFFNLTSIVSDLTIILNKSLVNLDGLNNITSIGRDLQVADNDDLINLGGLSKITTVGRSLGILYNDALTNLNGLNNITSLVGNLIIIGCPSLMNLEGINNIILVDGDLWISENSILTNFCAISSLINEGGLTGYYKVYNNNYNPTEQDIKDGNCSQ